MSEQASQKRQVGGRKEAPLAVVGSNELDSSQQHEKILTPEDAEYLRYSELLQGFFQKITRWLKIAQAEKYQGDERERVFSVIRSDNTLSIKTGTTWIGDDTPDKVLQVRSHTYLDINVPEFKALGEEFLIRPGQAEKQLLVDPEDGKPLEEIEITV